MSEWFVVNYLMGRRFGRILIYAHDIEQACDVAEIQAHHKDKSTGQIKIISVRTESEDEKYNKEISDAIASGKKVL
jgi:hypothetical protein